MKKSAFFIIVFSLIHFITQGQPSNPNGNSTNKSIDDAPITGIEYLLGIGGLYGIRRLMKRKSSDKD